jgi:tetratricopeptide (TPR) repeat protein
MIVGWEQKLALKENLAETAIESFKKAYELDPKLGSKIAVNAMTLANALAQQGDVLNLIGKTAEAAYNFELAYRAQQVCPEAKANAANLYNAGLLNTIHASSLEGEEAIAAFAKSQSILTEALEAGYKDETGNIYYYLFHSYYGQKDVNRDEFLPKAKNALLEGIKLYPKNSTILDGLMNLYTAEEGIGDPAELTTMIEESLKADPTNYDLWFGRGRVYNAMKDYDECIKSFEKCAELRPNDFEPYFYTGYFIIEKANSMVEQLNANTGLSYEDYNKENDKINLVFAEAIPWLEKAFNIKSDDAATIEYLNMLCFRLRDMDGIMEKYNKYHPLFEQLR